MALRLATQQVKGLPSKSTTTWDAYSNLLFPRDLHSYFVWSLLDNCEWAQQYTKRFGLDDVDDQRSGAPQDVRAGSLASPAATPSATAPARRGS